MRSFSSFSGLAGLAVLSALLTVAGPASALAQVPHADAIARINVHSGDPVKVTTSDGSRQTAALVGATSVGIELRPLRSVTTQTIPWSNVREIERRTHTIRKSTLVGLGVGLAVAAVSVAFTDACVDEGQPYPGECSLFFGGIGAGALTGLAINGANSRLIYCAPQKTSFSIVPVMTKGRVGVSTTIRW